MSGLKETFLKRYIVERTSKAEIRREEQSEKAESCRENLWNEIQLRKKNIKKEVSRHKNRIKRSGQARLVYVKKHKPQHPHHVKVSPRGLTGK